METAGNRVPGFQSVISLTFKQQSPDVVPSGRKSPPLYLDLCSCGQPVRLQPCACAPRMERKRERAVTERESVPLDLPVDFMAVRPTVNLSVVLGPCFRDTESMYV
ncbi:Hypothetical predicted protein [Scomber scombrus]|uniref:Uncharacterized protein n=1 Tax=Scomber scombrus TaxID=13677 RepID=A0AAV1PKG7_SCOSC